MPLGPLARSAWAVIRFISIIGAAFVGLSVLIVYNQERLIFPGVTLTPPSLSAPLPPTIRAIRFETADGETLHGFTSIQDSGEGRAASDASSDHVGLIFHGNGELAAQLNFMPFFGAPGIPALTFDYRGYGHSTGWPSEAGLYEDARAAARYLAGISGVPYERFIILGNSIGAGPASFLSREISPHALILLAAYSDLPSVVRETSPYGILARFLRFEFPVAAHLRGTSESCVVLAHGARDTIISIDHLSELTSATSHLTQRVVLRSDTAGHNDLFSIVKEDLTEALRERCRI